MTGTMIERVARALEARRQDLIAQPISRIYDELAKAAIEAMRPTDALANEAVDRALVLQEHRDAEKANVRFLNCYIDAALQETKG
jgi:hypothetical protein